MTIRRGSGVVRFASWFSGRRRPEVVDQDPVEQVRAGASGAHLLELLAEALDRLLHRVPRFVQHHSNVFVRCHAPTSLVYAVCSVTHRGADGLSQHHLLDVAGHAHVEDHDRAARSRGRAAMRRLVHEPQILLDGFLEAQPVVARRVGIELGIGVVHPVHLGGLQDHVGLDLRGAQRGGGVGGEVGVAGARRRRSPRAPSRGGGWPAAGCRARRPR